MVVTKDSQCRFFTLSETVSFLLCCPKVHVFAGVGGQGNMGERGVPIMSFYVVRDVTVRVCIQRVKRSTFGWKNMFVLVQQRQGREK